MKALLKDWSMLGLLLIQLNPGQFDSVLDAVRRIVEREEVLSESYRASNGDGVVGEIVDRFRN